MGEVIRPNFGRKPEQKSEPQEQAPAPETSLNQALSQDIGFFFLKPEKREAALKRMEEFTAFEEALKGFVEKKETVDLRRAGLAKSSLEQLCDLMIQSSEMQWKTDPSFYVAVRAEMYARIETSRASLAKLEREP